MRSWVAVLLLLVVFLETVEIKLLPCVGNINQLLTTLPVSLFPSLACHIVKICHSC